LKVALLSDRVYSGKSGLAAGKEFVELILLDVENFRAIRYTSPKEDVAELGFEGPSETVYELSTTEGNNMRLVITKAEPVGRLKMTVEESE